MWQRSSRNPDLKARELSFKHLFTVNDNTNAEVYGPMGWEGAGPYTMTRQVIWDVTPKIQAPALVTYSPGSERHRALERFLDTLPRAKGMRDAPGMGDPESLARMLIDFYKNPGV
jgi:hypothetical protein